jgi:hypothetical protein
VKHLSCARLLSKLSLDSSLSMERDTSINLERRHDEQHNDIQHNDTQHNNTYAECHYAECRILLIVMLNNDT